MKTTPEQWQATLKKVYERAATDDAFRARCLSDARGVIKEIGGGELPANANIRFVERLEETVFVLPPKRGVAGEVSEEELDMVAGGMAQGHHPPGGICGDIHGVPTCVNSSTQHG